MKQLVIELTAKFFSLKVPKKSFKNTLKTLLRIIFHLSPSSRDALLKSLTKCSDEMR